MIRRRNREIKKSKQTNKQATTNKQQQKYVTWVAQVIRRWCGGANTIVEIPRSARGWIIGTIENCSDLVSTTQVHTTIVLVDGELI